MTFSRSEPKPTRRKCLPLLLVAIVAVALATPAVVYGGFMVNVATATFNETTAL